MIITVEERERAQMQQICDMIGAALPEMNRQRSLTIPGKHNSTHNGWTYTYQNGELVHFCEAK